MRENICYLHWIFHESGPFSPPEKEIIPVKRTGAYLRKIAPMASTKIAFYIYYLLIISPGIHVYVYYMVFAKLLQENYLKNHF
jgi:hypothetical protein